MSDEALEAEVVEEKKNLPVKKEGNKPVKKGKLSLRYKTIAQFAARGYPVDVIAKQVNMTSKAVYRIIEKNELVWEEMNNIIKSIFSESDRVLASLFHQALLKLSGRMNDPKTEQDALEKVLSCYGKRTSGSDKPPIIQQFFQGGGQGQGPMIESIDEVILKRRKERGLDVPKKEEVEVVPDADPDDEGETAEL